MSCCIGELGDKEVVNVCNGKRLGCVVDVEIDVHTGRLCAIIVPGNMKIVSFSRKDLRIPWDMIECIGDDTILVRLPEDEECYITKKHER